MKAIIRAFVFSAIALYVTHLYVGAFDFGSDPQKAVLLLLIAMTLLNIFVLPVFKIVRLPSKGLGYLVLNFVMLGVTFYAMPAVISEFRFTSTTMPELIIFGYVLPSKSLTETWSLVFSALMSSIVISFFKWLCSKR